MEDTSRVLTKSASAYEHLKRLAVRGELRLDRRLSPSDLATSFRISETPVRAALGRLAAEGFIRGEASHGYFTKLWSFEEQRDLLELLAIHTVSSLETAGPEARPAIRVELAVLGAAAAAAEGLAGGAAYSEALERCLVQLAVLAGNAVAVEVVRNAAERTHRLRRFDFEDPRLRRDSAEILTRIAELVLGGDLMGASEMARRDLAATVARLPALVERANLEAAKLKFP